MIGKRQRSVPCPEQACHAVRNLGKLGLSLSFLPAPWACSIHPCLVRYWRGPGFRIQDSVGKVGGGGLSDECTRGHRRWILAGAMCGGRILTSVFPSAGTQAFQPCSSVLSLTPRLPYMLSCFQPLPCYRWA